MPLSTVSVPSDWPKVLEEVLARARELGPRGVMAFDLDSTLFDNRPRQARIVREFGKARGLPALESCAPHHFDAGWDMKAAFRNCGLSAEQTDEVFAEARRFWAARFFTSPYCLDDEPIEGAADFLQEVLQTRAQIAYVTGRPEAMREGSVGAMARHGFPIPGEGPVTLLMKPSLDAHDDDFKRTAHDQVGQLGVVIACFDNEPTHANDYRRKFPDARVIHLATDHSGRPVELLEGITSVPHFRWR